MRIGNAPHQRRNALDDLRDALEEEEEEAEEDRELHRPQDESAEVRRGLLLLVGRLYPGVGLEHAEDGERHEDDDVPDEVDDVAPARRHLVDQDVDADMLVAEQGPGRADQDGSTEQVPLQLEGPVGADGKQLANGGVERTDEDRTEDEVADAAPEQ